MDILVTGSAGFCFGVKRAVDLAYQAAQETRGTVATLGPLIHNPQVVKKLENEGVVAKESLGQIVDGVCVLRSHGVTSSEIEEAQRKGLTIIDATCPFVTRSQMLIRQLINDGYYVVIVGNSAHPEVRSLVSYSDPSRTRVVKSPEDLDSLNWVKKMGLLAQTTQPMSLFQEVLALAVTKAKELRVYNTICDATTIRQEESVELAPMVDCLIVVGGRESSNTRKLVEACREVNARTYHIEEPGEVDPAWIARAAKVGITAGASTPLWLVQDVVLKVKELSKDKP